MSTVTFLKDKTKIESVSQKIFSEVYSQNQDILIKIHFGEPGNKTALTPTDIKPIISSLKKLGLKPTFIDTPVAYDSPRATVKSYQKFVKDVGWEDLAPCIISDNYIKIKTKNLTLKACKELLEAKNLLVISHIKGHPASGFGGAIKNFGMGGMMVDSKIAIHHGSKPRFNSSSCTGCGTCSRVCPAGAIKMVESQPKIDLDVCWGCSVCEVNCPTKSLTPVVALFDDLLAQGAAACINNLPKKSFYINFVQNISKSCDCESDPGELIAPDIGVLFSDNPVAIDHASVDLVGGDIFKNTHHKDPYLHLKHASEHTQLSPDYKIVKI